MINSFLYPAKEENEIMTVVFAVLSDKLHKIKWLSKKSYDLVQFDILQSKQNQRIESLILN